MEDGVRNKPVLLLDLREVRKRDPWSIDIARALAEALEAFSPRDGRANFALYGLLILNSCVIYELKARSLLGGPEGLEDRETGDGEAREAGQPGLPGPFVPGLLRPRTDFLATAISVLLSSLGRRPSTGVKRAPGPAEARAKPPEPPEPDFDLRAWEEHILAILRARGPVLPLDDVLAVFSGQGAMRAFLTILHMAQEGRVAILRHDGAVLVALTAGQ